jgi:hypothetical protein
LHESGILEKKEDMLDFVKKNRNKVEKGKGFTRYLMVADATTVKSKKSKVESQKSKIDLMDL